jgi:alkyl hydroperoxide reductase subunit AhpF
VSVLGEPEQRAVRELLGALERDVDVVVETGPVDSPVSVITTAGEIDFNARAVELAHAVGELGERVSVEVVERDTPGRWPAFTIGGRLHYVGLPWGYELSTLVGAIRAAGGVERRLREESRTALAGLQRDVRVDVYVTPT